MEIAATPPTTPPAMAPTFELLCEAGWGVEVPVVVAGAVRPAVGPVVVVVPEESPISEPGSTSGVSDKRK
jgi:hypothetical protein